MLPTGLAPLARFHCRVGARLALRAAAPLAGVPFVAVLLQHDPGAALRQDAAWLLRPLGGPGPGLAVALVAATLAGWAQPRLSAGLGGWPRQLPAAGATHRRAVLGAIVVAQAPLLIALLALAPVAAAQQDGVALSRLFTWPLILAGSAVASWPGTGARSSRPLAVVALALLLPASWAGVVVAAGLVVLAERRAGPLAPRASARRRRNSCLLPTEYLVAVRALGWSSLGWAAVSLTPVLAMAALRVNNDLAPAVAAGAARFGGGLGAVLLVATLAQRLAVRRPVWPWARSLPVGSSRRVAEDALLLAAATLVPLAATALLDPLATLTVALWLPLLALRAVAGLRATAAPGRGAPSRLLGEGALLAASVTLVPWAAVLAFLATPLAWRAAASRDRAQKVSRWEGLHHRAVGDPLSWSAR